MNRLDTKHKPINQGIYKDISIKTIFTLVMALFISILVWFALWHKNRDFIHIILGLISICMGFTTFLIIWNKGEYEECINNILGFGFLAVAILNLMHTYYYKFFLGNDLIKGEFSIRFDLLSRLVEIIVLLVFSFMPYKKNINKNIMLIYIGIGTSCLFYVLYNFPNLIPHLYNERGITTIKIVVEYLVILMALLSLFRINKYLLRGLSVNFKYLFICILLIIPSEICFVVFRDLDSFWIVFAHVFSICSSYYLYKAVFQSLVKYPYDKLRENNQRLSDILNAIPISIHTYNSDKNIDFINKKFEELFKYSKENILGLSDKEILNLIRKVGNGSENTLPIRVANDEGDTQNIIRTFLDSSDQEVKVLVNAHKIKNGILVLLSDVKQEQEIKNLNLQAQTIINAAALPTMVIDYTGEIVACNNSFADLVEVDYKDIIGIKVQDLNNITNIKGIELKDIFNINSFRDDVNDCTIETPRGNKKDIQLATSVITNIYNEKIGLLTVVKDISKMKEEQLKLINQEKLAILGQMGASIVHETRNFLTTIKGNSQLIELYADDEKIKEYAKKINISTNEVNRIISDFLNLSKPRQTELDEIGFNDLVLSMKSTIETSSQMNAVKIILDLNHDERYILCDETQIRQVILNIYKNAVEAMEETENPVLHISTGLDEKNKEVFIRISDNGKGIDNETIKKIGTPFFTTKKTGTGLGLNVCCQIVREHKGKLKVESELGKGTTFTINIPYIDIDLNEVI